jgi:uncharacterized protein (DUF924 family)
LTRPPQGPLERGGDLAAFRVQSTFFYLPFEHSEALEDQHLAVAKIRAAHDRTRGAARKLLEETVDYAVRHQGASGGHQGGIERFGRFPHRNEIRGLHSTPQLQDRQSGSTALTRWTLALKIVGAVGTVAAFAMETEQLIHTLQMIISR